tara:strand:+ start:616 stop:984 length:369 start_codon:yes stop_codon:yes gene_type:complete
MNKAVKQIWTWGHGYGHTISEEEDLTLVEYTLKDMAEEDLNDYLLENGHADYLAEDGMELLEEQEEFESDGEETRIYGMAFLVLNCMKEQMGKGKEPTLELEKIVMKVIMNHWKIEDERVVL